MVVEKKIEKAEDEAFEISLWIKGFDGVLEVVGGLFLLFIKPETFNNIAVFLTQHELSRDPKDLFANFLIHASKQITHRQELFGSIFLLTHGAVKIILVWALLKKIKWAYPTAIAIFGGFVVYQSYRIYLDHSIWLSLITLFDIVIIILTWIEYRRLFPKSVPKK